MIEEKASIFHRAFSNRDEESIPFERLVFSSGSAKGAGYLGCIPALLHTGILPDVKKVVGSSAGSIMAALVAIGIDFSSLKNESMNIQNEILRTNFSELLGKRVGSLFNNTLGICAMTRDGKPLEEKGRQFINATILNFMESEIGKALCSQNRHLNKLYKRFTHESNPKFTFLDLHRLHRALPRRFKDLTILTVELPNGSECVLDYKSAPDFEIALACRASSAIPVVLEPIIACVNGVWHTLIDGGIFDLLPSEYFDRDELGNFIPNTREKQTLLLAFADDPILENSSAYKAIHTNVKPIYDPLWLERIVRDYAPWLLGSFEGPYTNSERWNLVYERIRSRYADNLVILGVGEIRHFEFHKATKLGREMSAICYVDTVFYIIDRQQFQCPAKIAEFFATFPTNFCKIYLDLIKMAGVDPQDDCFYNVIENYLCDQKIDLGSITEEEGLRFCRYIRERVRNRFESYECFAFSRACEWAQNLLTQEELYSEIQKRSLSCSQTSNSLDLSIFLI